MLRICGLLALIVACVACNRNPVTGLATSPIPPTSTSFSPTPVPDVETGEFQGHYVSGFEVSAFVPCDMDGLPNYGHGYWLEATAESGFFEKYKSFLSKDYDPSHRPEDLGTIVFVHVLGEVSPLKNAGYGAGTNEYGYGHLGLYPRLITVTKVLEMAPHANNQCKK